MNLHDREKFSKIINNVIAFTKIVLSLFLILVVLMWLAQFLELEIKLAFMDNLSDALAGFSTIFYTPSKDDESVNALLYVAIAAIFFLLIFEAIADIVSDVLKINDSNKEVAIIEENEKVNKNIQRNYQNMLKTSFNFVVMFKLNINNPLNSAQAFEDENLKAKIKKEEMQIIKDIFSIITMSIKAPIKSRPDMLVIEARSPEELGRIIAFIMSVCDIEKYIKAGVGYFMGVSVHSKEESSASAVEEAQKLIDLKNNRTVLCHQIVCECLKQVKHLGLSFESFGQYSTDENETLFKIVNKK